MLNFYRNFLLQAAGVLTLLKYEFKGPGKSLTWCPALDSPFGPAKDLLSSVSELVHPPPGAQISLAVDASDSHMGLVLRQLLDGSWAPWLSERKYTAFNRELISYLLFSRHFCFLLEGRESRIFTDHKPLTLALYRVFCLGPPGSRAIWPPWSSSPAL